MKSGALLPFCLAGRQQRRRGGGAAAVPPSGARAVTGAVYPRFFLRTSNAKDNISQCLPLAITICVYPLPKLKIGLNRGCNVHVAAATARDGP